MIEQHGPHRLADYDPKGNPCDGANWPREPLQQPTCGFVHNNPTGTTPQAQPRNRSTNALRRPSTSRVSDSAATLRAGLRARHHVVASGPIQSGNCRWVVAAIVKLYYMRQNRARYISRPVPLWRDHGPNDRWNTMAADPS